MLKHRGVGVAQQMKKKTSLRHVKIDPNEIPGDCDKIVISQNKTRIVIKNVREGCQLTSVDNKHQLLLKRIQLFFDVRENFEKLRPILVQESDVSLRVLDWSTTNWSKHNTVILDTTRNGYPEKINMYLDYKASLRAYSKRSFDPFCRRERIFVSFECDPNKQNFITTTAQLNFFKWAIESNVIDYCQANLQTLEADMVSKMRVKTD